MLKMAGVGKVVTLSVKKANQIFGKDILHHLELIHIC